MRLLLVEDDEELGSLTREGLIKQGYTVDWLKDGVSAEQALETDNFDVVILDIGLPRRSGFEVLQHVRNKGVMTPVLILTALDSENDMVKGLDIGGDDYMAKPFDIKVLCARVRALQRRNVDRPAPTIEFKGIKLDPAAHVVYHNDKAVNMTRREFSLLQKLLVNVGRVLSREQLTESLYGWEGEVDSNALEVHIHNLRKKFGTQFIRTIRGVGYVVEKDE